MCIYIQINFNEYLVSLQLAVVAAKSETTHTSSSSQVLYSWFSWGVASLLSGVGTVAVVVALATTLLIFITCML